MSRRVIANTVFIVLAVVLLGAAGLSRALVANDMAGVEHTIRVTFLGSVQDEDYFASRAFKDEVERASNGRIAVAIYPSGQFCSNERECIDGLQTGVADIFMTTIGGFGNFYGPGQVFDLPYTFADDTVAECVFDGPIVEDLRQTVIDAGLGVRLIVVSNTGGWRNFATTTKQVRSPADLQGLKIRTTPAPIQQELTRQLTANPTPVAWSEVYTALATGVVEGTKNSVQDIVSMRLHEQVKFIALDRHAYMGALWWYSQPRWEALSAEDRALVTAAAEQFKIVGRALPKQQQAEAYAVFEAEGGTVYSPTLEERAAFRAAASGMRDWYAGRYGREWLVKLDAAVAACAEPGL